MKLTETGASDGLQELGFTRFFYPHSPFHKPSLVWGRNRTSLPYTYHAMPASYIIYLYACFYALPIGQGQGQRYPFLQKRGRARQAFNAFRANPLCHIFEADTRQDKFLISNP